jgi:hypothetical protein
MDEKLPVAALHQLESEADKTARLVAQLVGYPVAFRDRRDVEKPGRDVRIGRPEEARIKRAEREDEARLAVGREGSGIRAGSAAVQGPPQAERGGDTDLEEPVERQEGGIRSGGFEPIDADARAGKFNKALLLRLREGGNDACCHREARIDEVFGRSC